MTFLSEVSEIPIKPHEINKKRYKSLNLLVIKLAYISFYMYWTKKYVLPLNCIPHFVYHNTAPVSFSMGLRVDNTNILFINSSPCWFLQRRAKRGHERLTKIGNWNFNWLLKPYFSYSPYHVYQSTIRISKYFKVNTIHII